LSTSVNARHVSTSCLESGFQSIGHHISAAPLVNSFAVDTPRVGTPYLAHTALFISRQLSSLLAHSRANTRMMFKNCARCGQGLQELFGTCSSIMLNQQA
jgi:hypothetical protein